MGIPDHLTCLLRNLYAGQEATVRTGPGTTNWFQIEKAVHQGFPGGSVVNNPPTDAGATGSIPGPGRSHMP